MQGIKDYNTFEKIEAVNKGWSSDKKYFIETIEGKQLLLRMAKVQEFERKQAEFEIVSQVAALGIPMSQPIDCDFVFYNKFRMDKLNK